MTSGIVLIAGLAAEDIGKRAAQNRQGLGRGVDRQRGFLPHVVRADIVEAQNVIGMGVGVDDGVEAVQFFAQRLKAEIGVVSMTTCWPSRESSTEGRVRLSWGSLDWQTRNGSRALGRPWTCPSPARSVARVKCSLPVRRRHRWTLSGDRA